MPQCDVAVIGAGPGGYVAAIRCAQRGAKVIVIERKFLGGVCLNVGCIPTKTFIYTAEMYRRLKHAEDYGLKVGEVSVDMNALLKRKSRVVSVNTGGIEALFKAYGIQVVNGEARIIAPGKIAVGDQEVTAKSIIVATGGRPAILKGLEFNNTTIIGSTRALEMTEVPKRIAVIGAGAMGGEFACVWNAFGAEVTLIEAMPTILPREDEELTKRLEQVFKKKGIDVRAGTKVAKATPAGSTVTLELEGAKAGKIEVDMVMVSVGLQCNSEVVTSNPGLGVKVGPRGGILVNEKLESSVPGIYAIGDVIDKTWLAHGASAEAIVAATNVTGGNKKMDYRVVPACNFTSPEVASVGLSEKKAKEQGINVKTGRFMFMGNGRAHAIGETEGMVKIVGDAATDEIVGVHIMGPEAGEMIATAALAMRMEATVEEIVDTIHTHPTLSEVMHEAAEDYYGLSIHSRPKKS